ncbi:hypothetical protein AV656_13010 [Bhargavaea cecembensis]|uniref:Nitroreductase domain-containing protein n=1 Tax=Bhargavaea cecembensis TaxID=394098 RepID=A0A165GSH0_9BACL|nr:hypothetical protein [Bhargavaea cecembensis]KZE37479.1 hypothetical protein AV656_13010 [Bhargavaea cecembensis]
MDAAYLEAFTDRRFEHFSRGGLSPDPDLIGEAVRSGMPSSTAPQAERLMRSVYGYTEKIRRVDLASRYPFHPLVPGARNMRTAKILVMTGGLIHAYDPFRDRVMDIGPAEDDAGRVVLMTDDRRLQLYYGEFSRMLSALNAGHALFNLEFALRQAGCGYRYAPVGSSAETARFTGVHIRPRVVLRLGPGKDTDRGQLAAVPDAWLSAVNKRHFINRTADQRGEGDVFFRRKLAKRPFDSLMKLAGPVLEKTGIRMLIAVNDVAGLSPGYYGLEDSCLVWAGTFQGGREDQRLLTEYHEYSNFHGFNFWVFMAFSKKGAGADAEPMFMEMGRLMQLISIFMAGENCAVRCLKNYDDAYVRSRTGLPEDMAIGYSAIVFPDRNQAVSVRIPEGR